MVLIYQILYSSIQLTTRNWLCYWYFFALKNNIIYYVYLAPKRPAPKRPAPKRPAPKRPRQNGRRPNGRAKTSCFATQWHINFVIYLGIIQVVLL